MPLIAAKPHTARLWTPSRFQPLGDALLAEQPPEAFVADIARPPPRPLGTPPLPAGHDQQQDEYLPLVLRTFIWGFPHQYQAPAPDGTAIALEIPGTGA